MFRSIHAHAVLRSTLIAGLLASAPWGSAYAAEDSPAPEPQAPNAPTTNDASASSTNESPVVPKNNGILLGGGVGVAIPGGGLIEGGAPIGDVATTFPLGSLSAGFRFLDSFFLGTFIEGGTGTVNTTGAFAICDEQGVECKAGVVRVGLEARGYLFSQSRYQPWLGAGFGYEWFTFSGHDSLYDESVSLRARGPEQLRLSGGVNVWLTDMISVNTFGAYSRGRFSSVELAMTGAPTEQLPGAAHHWVSFISTFNATL